MASPTKSLEPKTDDDAKIMNCVGIWRQLRLLCRNMDQLEVNVLDLSKRIDGPAHSRR